MSNSPFFRLWDVAKLLLEECLSMHGSCYYRVIVK